MTVTRDNIFYDFSISPFRVRLDNLEFVFSSQLYKDKFLQRYSVNRNTINESLSNRFKQNITVNEICDIFLYFKIEKRGCLIVNHETKELYKCQNDIVLSGQKMTRKNLSDL